MSAHGLAGPRGSAMPRPGTRPDIAPSPGPSSRPPVGRPGHLRVVDPNEQANQRRRRLVRLGGGLLAAFVVALLFVAVGMHVMLAQNQFKLDRLNKQAAAEQAAYQKLRLQVDQLESPQRILSTAQGRLGMVLPPSVTFLTPSTGSSLVGTGAGGRSLPQATTATGATGTTSRAQSAPAPATAPPGWSLVKPQLGSNP